MSVFPPCTSFQRVSHPDRAFLVPPLPSGLSCKSDPLLHDFFFFPPVLHLPPVVLNLRDAPSSTSPTIIRVTFLPPPKRITFTQSQNSNTNFGVFPPPSKLLLTRSTVCPPYPHKNCSSHLHNRSYRFCLVSPWGLFGGGVECWVNQLTL